MQSNDQGRERNPSISTLEKEIEKMNKQMEEFLAKAQQKLQQHDFNAAIELIKAAQVVHEDMVDTTKELEEKKKALNDAQQQNQQQ